ncbi:MYXO-CTERM sorting domain-containing protein [Agromyces sp. NPDC058136]|uniref:MYXO-CTERM sorting domain-containing protein n=1 Tax=Agromyces sp. NPDC058136 TaxID=3346354 RepID=UPI0036D7BBD5
MNWVLIIGGILLTLAGIVWTFQGLGLLPGSAMSGVTLWAILGPITAVVGVALLSWGVARRRRGARS